jgi:hypothetical protein
MTASEWTENAIKLRRVESGTIMRFAFPSTENQPPLIVWETESFYLTLRASLQIDAPGAAKSSRPKFASAAALNRHFSGNWMILAYAVARVHPIISVNRASSFVPGSAGIPHRARVRALKQRGLRGQAS